MTEHQNHDDCDAALDRLLAEGRWPEPAPDQLARLRDRWRGLTRARRQRRSLLAGAAVAAAILAMAGLSVLWRQQSESNTGTPAPEIAVVFPNDTVGQGRGERSTASLVRDPTLYERVVLASYAPSSPARHISAKNKHGRSARSSTADASKVLAKSFPLALDAVARRAGELLFGALWSYEQLLTGARRETERLIVHAAARVRQARTIAIASSAEGRAVEAVARNGEVSDIASLLVRQTHHELRHRLLRELLSRGTEESVGAYLTFVALPQSRGEALAALQSVRQSPSAALLTYLHSPHAESRNAAALALANSPDPNVIAALAASLEDASLRRSALLALLLNPAPQAAAVLHEAREDLYLMASVRAAEFELQHVTNAFER